MQKGNKVVGVIIAAIVVLILAAGITFALMNQKTSAPQPSTDTSEETNDAAGIQPESEASDEQEASITIVYTDDGFSPADYTVKAGDVVRVENKSSSPLQFSSDNHPTHTHQMELNLTILETGESTTFTPTKTGKWGFHDHLNATRTGTLTVE